MVAVPYSAEPAKMTPEEYLVWEARQDIRHEYCNGDVFAMAGGTKNHDALAFNLRRALVDAVEEQGCQMSGSDVKVLVRQSLSYRYPDLTVGCDPRDAENDTFYEFPKLIVEVLSPSTVAVDRDEKFKEYIQIPTLQEYVLISSVEMSVECFRRGEGRMWLYFPYGPGDSVELKSVGVVLPVEQLYRNVQLEGRVEQGGEQPED